MSRNGSEIHNSSLRQAHTKSLTKTRKKIERELRSIKNNKSQNEFDSGKKKKRFLRIEEANKIYKGYVEDEGHVSDHQPKKRKRKFMIRDSKKTKESRKMPYFMETLEIKNQISQLEIENRRLQINYAKLRKMNLEKLDIIKRNEEYAMIPSEDEEEEEKYVKKASSILRLKMKINEINWNIDQKNREIKRLKLIKRELSEREFMDRIKKSMSDSRKYRNQAFRLMKKYKGFQEGEGMNEELTNKYQYQNMVLEEYEEMLKEVDHNKQLLLNAKTLRKNEIRGKIERIEGKTLKIENIKDKIHFLNEKMEDIEGRKRVRAKYDREHLMKIELERANLSNIESELKSRKNELDQEYTQLQSRQNELLEIAKKEKMKKVREFDALKNMNRTENSIDKTEEDIERSLSQKEVSTHRGPIVKLKRVDLSDIRLYGEYLRYKFMYYRQDPMNIFKYLIKREEDTQYPNLISLNQVEINLKSAPIGLKEKKESRLLARYIVEDNVEDYIFFDSRTKNSVVVVKSIWRNLNYNYKLFGYEEMNQIHDDLTEIIQNATYNLKVETKKMGNPQHIGIQEYFDLMKNCCSVDFTQEQKDYMLMHLCSASSSIEKIKFREIFNIFTGEGKEEYFKLIGGDQKLREINMEKKMLEERERELELEREREEEEERERRRQNEEEERERRRQEEEEEAYRRRQQEEEETVRRRQEESDRKDREEAERRRREEEERQVEMEKSEEKEDDFFGDEYKQEESYNDNASSYHSNSKIPSSRPSTEKKPSEEQNKKDGINLNFFDDNDNDNKGGNEDPFAKADGDFNFDNDFENSKEEDSLKLDEEQEGEKVPITNQSDEFSYTEDPLREQGFGKGGFKKPEEEDSFLNYNDDEVDHLEGQLDDEGEKNDNKKSKRGKESLEMVENQFNFKVEGESSKFESENSNLQKLQKNSGVKINLNMVDTFNDEKTKSKVESEYRQTSKYEDIDDKKIKFKTEDSDSGVNEEVKKSREDMLKDTPKMNIIGVENFNDEKTKKTLEEQHKMTSEYKEEGNEAKLILKGNSDDESSEEQVDREHESKQFNINISQTSTFNDPNSKKIVEEQEKQKSKFEDIEKSNSKIMFNSKSIDRIEKEKNQKKSSRSSSEFKIGISGVETFNDQKVKEKLEQEDKIKAHEEEEKDENKFVFKDGDKDPFEEGGDDGNDPFGDDSSDNTDLDFEDSFEKEDEDKDKEEDYGDDFEDGEAGGDAKDGEAGERDKSFDMKNYRPFTLNKQKTPKISQFGMRDSKGQIVDISLSVQRSESNNPLQPVKDQDEPIEDDDF